MRKSIVAAGLAVLLNTGWAKAQDTDTGAVVDFVLGNAYHVILHEIGHLLIDQLRLPVLGQEEDAADNFATLTLLDWDNAFADGALADAAHAWFVRQSFADVEDAGVFFDEHDLDIQRAFRIVCHLVGVDPVAFEDLAKLVELPDSERGTCEYNYQLSADSWGSVLEPHRPDEGHRNEISVVYEDATDELLEVATIIREAEILEDIQEFLDESVELPSPVILSARTCGEANAFFDPSDTSITICYELLDEMAEIYYLDVE